MQAKNATSYDNNLKDWIDFILQPEGNEKPNDKWLTIADLCSLLRCSEPSIYRKIKSGNLNYSKPAGVMVWLSDVAKFVIQKESYNKAS
jgi:predicted DNA-binding transcriptional regulator AlpA